MQSNMRTKPSFFIRYFGLFVFLFMGRALLAQDPIIVSINLIPPYPNFAYEIVNMDDQAIITLQNTDFNNSYAVKLGIELSGGNGIIVRSKENALPNQAINLGPGETMVLSSQELSGFYNNYTESDFDFIGITIQDVLNDQQLPDGSYTVCLRAYEYTSGFPLSSSSPAGCSFPFSVIAVDPPIITYPQNETTVSVIEPQLLNINWIPPSISLPDLRYRLEIVDLSDMQMNPYDAFLTGDFLFFYEEDIISNTFFYGMEYPLLLEGHEYAVRIAAYRLDGLLNVSNDGYSDIVTFTYGKIPEEEDLTPLPDSQLDCGSQCIYPLTGSESPGSDDPIVGDVLDFGNFQMYVSTINGTAPYSGTGVIQSTTYIPVGIKVEFENLKVTSNGRIFEGQAKASIRDNSWIDHTWTDLQSFGDDLNINNYDQLYTAANNADHHINSLAQQVGTSIPISIGDEGNSLQIVGINFFPDRASYNLSYLSKLDDDPNGTRYLHFMAKDLCITPGGPSLSEDEARLDLVKPLRYTFDNSTILTFQPVSSMVEGSYLSFDCNGFNGINASGDVRFSPDVFKPVNENGVVQQNDTLVATFRTTFVDWSDWVAFVSFNSDQDENADSPTENLFIYKELEDYIIRVENAFFDHSINSNPATMVFPENYSATSSVEWQGFYIETVSIDLPKWVKANDNNASRIQFIGNNLIVDSDGLTGLIQSENLVDIENGSMGKWPFSIDSLSIEFLQNDLQQAYFKGGLIIPVVEEPFDYTADIQYLNDTTQHIFTFNPLESYSFPAWFANVELEETSKLKVVIENLNSYVEARLHGNISFEPIIGDIDKMNITDISFNDLVIRSVKRPTYIEFGGIHSDLNPTVLAAAGFGILLDSMSWNEGVEDKTGLVLGLALDLGGDLTSITGGTTMLIKNKIIDLGETISIDYDGFSFSDISLDVESGAIDLKGLVSFFKNDEKFGDGFNGSLELNFIKTVKLNGTVLFGNKVVESNTVNYWYASAMAYMPTNPVPMATPLDVYGFGGGFYYNMALDPSFNLTPGAGASLDPKEVFSVSPGTLGFQASVLAALTPSTRTFNADVTLSVEINLNGGLNNISLDGTGYVMQEIDETNKEEAMVFSDVSIGINLEDETFTGHFGVHGNIPKETPILTVEGDIDLFVSPTLWYFRAGTPVTKLTTSLNLGFADDALSVGAYFMTGMQLIAPTIPNEVASFFNFNSTSMASNIGASNGIGFLAGVHLALDLDLTALGTGVQIVAMAGVDIGLINYATSTCDGLTDFGINKWYAQGQGYIYGSFILEVLSFDALSIQAGVILEGAFPNPTGVNGKVKTVITILGFDVDVSANFSLGTICKIEPIPGMEVDRLELELENMDLIGVVSPISGAPFVSTSIQPTVQWYKENGEMKGYIYGDGQGGIISKLFRFKNELSWELLDDNDNWINVNYEENLNEEENTSTLLAININGDPSLINGLSTFKLKARSFIEQFSGSIEDYQNSQSSGTWGSANYLEGQNQGQQIQEIKEHVFITRSNLTEIDPVTVAYTLPVDRQRFYPHSYLSEGRVNFKVDNTIKFEEFEECGFEIQAEFQKIDDQAVQVLSTNRPEPLNLEFDMGSLSPETIYKLQIVAERKIYDIAATMESDEDYSSCQIVNIQSLEEMFESFGLSTDLENFPDASILQNFGTNGEIYASLEESPDFILHRKVLYTLYFRTSKFATPQDKINSIIVSNTEVIPSGEFYIDTLSLPIIEYQSVFNSYLNTNTTIPVVVGFEEVIQQTAVEKALISLFCPEGFDRFDLLGHQFIDAPEVREYYKFYGPDQQNAGLAPDIQNWFETTNANLSGFGAMSSFADPDATMESNNNQFEAIETFQNMVETLPKLWEVNYSSDPSYAESIKYLHPLLSDIEVGLSSPEVVVNTSSSSSSSSTSSSSSGGFNFGGGGISGGYNFTPATNVFSSLVNLELEYRVEIIAFNNRKNILENTPSQYTNSVGPHQSPPAGIYPISILKSNDENPGYPSNDIPSAKILNANISFE